MLVAAIDLDGRPFIPNLRGESARDFGSTFPDLLGMSTPG
jgi:hypothetical protein